jgi:hypothetical protein
MAAKRAAAKKPRVRLTKNGVPRMTSAELLEAKHTGAPVECTVADHKGPRALAFTSAHFVTDRRALSGLRRTCRSCARAIDRERAGTPTRLASHYKAHRKYIGTRAAHRKYDRTPRGRAMRRLRGALRRALECAGKADLTATECAQITAIYSDAIERQELTGIEFHVDHRIPLDAAKADESLVRVVVRPANLEVLPKHLNLQKQTKSVAQFASECEEYDRWQRRVPEFEQVITLRTPPAEPNHDDDAPPHGLDEIDTD